MSNDDLTAMLERERLGGMPRWHVTPRPPAGQLPPADLHDVDELVHAVTGHRVHVADMRRVA